jgi:hypothetical protein
MAALLALAACGVPGPNPPAVAVATTTATGTPAATAAAASTTLSPVGVAVLGATSADFQAKYGPPSVPANPASGYLVFDSGIVAVGVDIFDGPASSYANRVRIITVGPAEGFDLNIDLATARRVCGALLPRDAVPRERITLTIDGSTEGEDDTYVSAWLAARFPASDFVDDQQHLVEPGAFDVRYAYAANNDPTNIVSCVLDLGWQQTQP